MVLAPSVVIASDRGEGEVELTVIPLDEALAKFKKAKLLKQKEKMEWWEALGEAGLN